MNIQDWISFIGLNGLISVVQGTLKRSSFCTTVQNINSLVPTREVGAKDALGRMWKHRGGLVIFSKKEKKTELRWTEPAKNIGFKGNV